jgi:hypothetical protein
MDTQPGPHAYGYERLEGTKRCLFFWPRFPLMEEDNVTRFCGDKYTCSVRWCEESLQRRMHLRESRAVHRREANAEPCSRIQVQGSTRKG